MFQILKTWEWLITWFIITANSLISCSHSMEDNELGRAKRVEYSWWSLWIQFKTKGSCVAWPGFVFQQTFLSQMQGANYRSTNDESWTCQFCWQITCHPKQKLKFLGQIKYIIHIMQGLSQNWNLRKDGGGGGGGGHWRMQSTYSGGVLCGG